MRRFNAYKANIEDRFQKQKTFYWVFQMILIKLREALFRRCDN